MNTQISLPRTLKDMFFRIQGAFGKLLLFGFSYQLAVALLFKPAIRFILGFSMRAKGYPVLINVEITDFFRSITGLLVGFVVAVIAAIAAYYEFSSILYILKIGEQKYQENQSLLFSLEKAFFSLEALQSTDIIGFFFYALLFLPLLGLGISSSILPSIDIPRFITGELEKHIWGIPALLAVIVLGVYLFVRLFFVLPIMAFEKESFFGAAAKSFRYTRKNVFRIFALIVLSMLLSAAIVGIPFFLFMQLRGILFLPFKIISLLLTVLAFAILPVIMVSASLVCYEEFAGEFTVLDDLATQELDSRVRKFFKKSWELLIKGKDKLKAWFYRYAPVWLAKRPYLLLVLLIIPIVAISDFLLPLHVEGANTLIIGHRGSLEGVENTLEAIEGAILQGADYAEIDILLSKDGVPMVIHDANLNRLAGERLYVGDLTAEELQKIQLKDRGYTGQIPTLDEVCKLTKGRIHLLIEMKLHGQETESVVEATIETIMDHKMEQQVKYQSNQDSIIAETKLKYPSVEMGHIIIGHLGKLSPRKIMAMEADFLGVEESFVTTQLVRASHQAGKPLYVWTINDAESAQHFNELEVDGIITDYPGMVAEVLQEEKE